MCIRDRYMPVARTHIDELSQQIIPWTTGVQYEPVFSLGNTMMESFSRLNQVERLMKKFPGKRITRRQAAERMRKRRALVTQ